MLESTHSQCSADTDLDRWLVRAGLEGRVIHKEDATTTADRVAAWRAAGASHVTINTMAAGHRTVDDHLAELADVSKALNLQ